MCDSVCVGVCSSVCMRACSSTSGYDVGVKEREREREGGRELKSARYWTEGVCNSVCVVCIIGAVERVELPGIFLP